MSEELHSGLHPDTDLLSAFLEGALPEHERAECLTHLADCAQCREVVFLARAAAETEAPEALKEAAVPFWRKLLRPIPVLAAVLTALLVFFTVGLYRMIRSAEQKPQETASVVKPAETAPTPLPATQTEPEPPQRVAKAKSRAAVPEPEPQQPQVLAAAPPPPPPVASTAAPSLAPAPAPLAGPAAPQNAAAAQFAANLREPLAPGAGVAGTITDPSGAVIPRAEVELKNDDTGATFTSASDARGQFSIAGLPPGRYDLSISSMGFQKFVKPSIQVQPETMARLDSTLQVGATTETVTVMAAAPMLQTESGQVSKTRKLPPAALPLRARSIPAPPLGPPYTLPDKSNPVSFAVKDKLVVAVSSSGTLFRSDDDGKSWKHIKGKWKGKVVRVVSPPTVRGTANTIFELTTDPASIWVSADGRKWTSAPASR